MQLDITTFETISLSRFISFTIPNPYLPNSRQHLRVAVLDSPVALPDSTNPVAAMFVPSNRESDWIFSTEAGHLQLLLDLPGIARLILIGDQPINDPASSTVYHRKMNNSDQERLEQSLKPLVFALSPKLCFETANPPEIPFVTYEDNVICSVVVEKCVGSTVGEMLVEDVEIESDGEPGHCREFRRRLRFKRMPNLVQTEIRIVPETCFALDSIQLGKAEFKPDVGILVHPYLAPMVASLGLISLYIENRIQLGFKPKALCVGVGGGALLGFLRYQLGFAVVGVELDQEVLRVAKQYFGLEEDEELINLHVGDAIEYLNRLSCQATRLNSCSSNGPEVSCCHTAEETQFDVLMVDLDSNDGINGISAPPLEFVTQHVLLAARSILSQFGLFVINVIPPNRSCYEIMIHEFKKVFNELYEINTGNEDNFILVASMLPVGSSDHNCENSFLKKLRLVIPVKYMDSIRKI